MTPPRKFSQTTSAPTTRRRTISIASVRRRSSVMDRLLPFMERNEGAIFRSAHLGSAGGGRGPAPPRGALLVESGPRRAGAGGPAGPAREGGGGRRGPPPDGLLP